MNILDIMIANTREIYDEQVKIANMILDRELAADVDAIKNCKEFKDMIELGILLTKKSGNKVCNNDVAEVLEYRSNYILNELVPGIKKIRDKHKN